MTAMDALLIAAVGLALMVAGLWLNLRRRRRRAVLGLAASDLLATATGVAIGLLVFVAFPRLLAALAVL
jgi:LPXTG-motif cell wall-anchored protein